MKNAHVWHAGVVLCCSCASICVLTLTRRSMTPNHLRCEHASSGAFRLGMGIYGSCVTTLTGRQKTPLLLVDVDATLLLYYYHHTMYGSATVCTSTRPH